METSELINKINEELNGGLYCFDIDFRSEDDTVDVTVSSSEVGFSRSFSIPYYGDTEEFFKSLDDELEEFSEDINEIDVSEEIDDKIGDIQYDIDLLRDDLDDILKKILYDEENVFENYSDMFYGVPLTPQDKEMGYISYYTLSQTFDAVLANWAPKFFYEGNMDVLSGNIDKEIFQWFLIDNIGAGILSRETNELVVSVEAGDVDFYAWGVDHIGTSWKYVPTNIKIVDKTVNK